MASWKAPNILILTWHPPMVGWIKVNSNGLAKGNLRAVILAIELAYDHVLLNLWLESDSLLAPYLFLQGSAHPYWVLRNRWYNCRHLIS